MRKVLFVGVLISAVFQGMGQYNQSVGVRLGHTSGLTFKKFMVEEEALDLMISGRNEGIQVTLNYVFHLPLEFSFNENLYAYYGIGGHVGYENYDKLNKVILSIDPPTFEYEEKSYFVMGVDAVVGVEYRWLSVPITLSLDLKPYFDFIGMRYTASRFWDGAFAIKYIF